MDATGPEGEQEVGTKDRKDAKVACARAASIALEVLIRRPQGRRAALRPVLTYDAVMAFSRCPSTCSKREREKDRGVGRSRFIGMVGEEDLNSYLLSSRPVK